MTEQEFQNWKRYRYPGYRLDPVSVLEMLRDSLPCLGQVMTFRILTSAESYLYAGSAVRARHHLDGSVRMWWRNEYREEP